MNKNDVKQRDRIIDIVKAIGIMLMVLGHISYGVKFISLFHMPLFFIAAGVFFKESSYENISKIKDYIIRKSKALLLPYIILNLILLYLHNFLMDINILTSNPDIMNILGGHNEIFQYFDSKQIFFKTILTLILFRGEQLFGACWFLKALFFISISFAIVSWILNKILHKFNLQRYFETFRILICILCLIVGFIFHKADFNFYFLGTMFSCAIFFEIGILFTKFKSKININLSFFIISTLCIVFYILKIGAKVNVSANTYLNPVWFVLCAVSGTTMIYYISYIINKQNRLSQLFSYIGQNTLSIMCLHFIFFKFITLIQVHVYNLPNYMLAAFPYLYKKQLWGGGVLYNWNIRTIAC